MNEGSPAGERVSWTRGVSTAAAWAMIASAAEFLTHAILWYGFGKPVYQGMDALWSKPLVNLLLFVPPALLLQLLPLRYYVACLAFPATAAPLLLLRPGSPIQMAILAAGIATQLGVRFGTPRRCAGTVRVGAWLAVLMAMAAVVSQGNRAWREHSGPAGMAAAGSPNVLLIILDTVRAASLSLHAGPASTPVLDSLAATGIVFDRAVSAAPWTLPSHASIFTGLWPHEHGADWRSPLDDRAPTLAGVMAGRGYRTGGFVANLVFTSREHGLARGFQVYRDYRRSPGALFRSASLGQTIATSGVLRRLIGFHEVAGRKRGADVNEEFLAWQERSGERPWFAFLNYYDAHEPYVPRPPFAGRYSSGLPARRFDRQRFWHVEGGIDEWPGLTPIEVAAERAAYEESISGLDADLGALLSALRQRGALENTLVVITSDHGELFGEHGTYTHGNSVYWRTLHVPLVFSWPGHLPVGARVGDPVSLRDLPATILGLVFPGAPALLPGVSLPMETPGADSAQASRLVLSALSTEEFTRDDYPMRNGALQSLAGATWQYTRAANGHEEVYRTGAGGVDTAVTDSLVRAAIVDTARARLAAARIPPPLPDSGR